MKKIQEIIDNLKESGIILLQVVLASVGSVDECALFATKVVYVYTVQKLGGYCVMRKKAVRCNRRIVVVRKPESAFVMDLSEAFDYIDDTPNTEPIIAVALNPEEVDDVLRKIEAKIAECEQYMNS